MEWEINVAGNEDDRVELLALPGDTRAGFLGQHHIQNDEEGTEMEKISNEPKKIHDGDSLRYRNWVTVWPAK